MLKFILFLIIPTAIFAQESNIQNKHFGKENQISIETTTFHEYVSLNENKVYDIEIIVFSYNNALPNYKTYTDKLIFDDSEAIDLQIKPEDHEFFKNKLTKSIDDNNIVKSETDLTVPLNDAQDDKLVLTWFQQEPDYYKLIPIWNRLIQNANITPLIHQSWRQVATPFDNPTYIKLNNLKGDIASKNNDTIYSPDIVNQNGSMLNDGLVEEIIEDKTYYYPDLTVTGMVALSQGRFMHFGHKLNLIRRYIDENNNEQQMVFSLTERKQLKTDELHYFDSPWFGSIVKITEYQGDEMKGENNEE